MGELGQIIFRLDMIWVCQKMRYTPNYSHLIGIMISKTIGCRGLAYFQTNPHKDLLQINYYGWKLECVGIIGGTCISNNIWNTALACLNIGYLHGFSSAYGCFNGEKDRLSTIIIFIFSDNPNLTKLSCGLTMEYQGTIGDWNNLS